MKKKFISRLRLKKIKISFSDIVALFALAFSLYTYIATTKKDSRVIISVINDFEAADSSRVAIKAIFHNQGNMYFTLLDGHLSAGQEPPESSNTDYMSYEKEEHIEILLEPEKQAVTSLAINLSAYETSPAFKKGKTIFLWLFLTYTIPNGQVKDKRFYIGRIENENNGSTHYSIGGQILELD